MIRQPADAQLRRLFKKMFQVIKLVHHFQNVSPKGEGSDGPRFISRMVEELATMIKPAGPTSQTMQMIQGNAENWGYNTLTILMDHYKEALDKTLEELDELLTPDWKKAFEVSTRWAKRHLQRLTRDAIDHAEALIAARVVPEDGQARRPRPRSPQRATTAVQTSVERPRRLVRIQEEPSEDPGEGPARAPPMAKDTAATTKKNVTLPLFMEEEEGLEEEEEEAEELPSYQVPRDQRVITRRVRAQPLRETEQPDLIDWVPIERTPLASTIPPVNFDLGSEMGDEAEQDEEDTIQRPRAWGTQSLSPVVASQDQRTSTPRQHQAQVHWSPLEEGEDDDWPTVLTDFTAGRFRPRRHAPTQRKLTEWELEVNHKWVLLGDSNVGGLPDHSCEDLQIESYPGGHFRHAQNVMEKAVVRTDVVVEKIILAFGINSRANKSKETTVKNLQAAVRAAKTAFPYAEIWIPLINYSTNLPLEEQQNLQTLNDHIQRNMGFLPLLPSHLFQTEPDDIHWTRETSRAMFRHWWRELNWPPLQGSH